MKQLCLLLLLALCLVPRPVAAALPPEADGIASVEERRLLAAIEERKNRFAEKEKALQLKEEKLSSLAIELDRRLEEMQKLRKQIADLLKQKKQAENERIKALSQMYEKMDKAKAAELLGKMDWDLSLAIMSQIKTKIRSKIISQMDPQYALHYTKAYSTLKQD
ncbi:MotE family protein [Geothermobacter hydrogeniphilus]|uniref:Flagellar motility protein MotE, a chaperone for MotC folding n=1 Tax=Geothermobacter hydrogeniphilus TaxID=1969733 RepID=A0A1X0YE77_9BACT|nr:hypothetical protein [Geothermobacter hydrogeniphilus]ORJ63521.1 hypothetical protein B5V00_01250 [Geothermobacter hydrogeniphilus]